MFFTSSYLHMLKRVEEGWDEDDYISHKIDSRSTSPSISKSKKPGKIFNILGRTREKLRRNSDTSESGNFSEASGYFGDDEVDCLHLPTGDTSDYDIINSVEVSHFQKHSHSLAWKQKKKKHRFQTGNVLQRSYHCNSVDEYLIIETPDDYAYNCPPQNDPYAARVRRISSCDTNTSCELPWSPGKPVWDADCSGAIYPPKASTEINVHNVKLRERSLNEECVEFCQECLQPAHSGSEKINNETHLVNITSDRPMWQDNVLEQLRNRNQHVRDTFYEFESCLLENCSCLCHGNKDGNYLEEYKHVLKYVRSQLETQPSSSDASLVLVKYYDKETLQMINQSRLENLGRVRRSFLELSPHDKKDEPDESQDHCDAPLYPRNRSSITISWWRENVYEQLKVRNYWESKSFCDKEIAEHQRVKAHPELEEFDVISDSENENISSNTLSLDTSRSLSKSCGK